MVTVALFGADEDSVLVRLRLREGGFGAVGAYVQEVQSGAVDIRDLRHVAVGWAACILIRPYDAEMARLAIREAGNPDAPDQADVDDDEGGEAAA